MRCRPNVWNFLSGKLKLQCAEIVLSSAAEKNNKEDLPRPGIKKVMQAKDKEQQYQEKEVVIQKKEQELQKRMRAKEEQYLEKERELRKLMQ